MPTPSPYGPDRSLLVATLVLVGGLGVVAGGVYLVSVLSADVSHWQQARVADAQIERSVGPSRSGARVPYRGRASMRGRTISPAPAGGRAPAWASGTPSTGAPFRAPTGGGYDLNPDFGHAQVGAPAPSTPAPSAGVASSSSTPNVGRAPLTVDLGRGTPSSSGAWRAEASRLNGRLRALSGAIAGLDRGSRRSAESNAEGTTSESSRASGGQSAARTSTNSAPGMPGSPDQVPVDGGLGWLAAAGAAYAVRRLHGASREDDTEGA